MSKTIVGLFPSTAAAQEVKQILITNDYDANDIKIVAADSNDMSSSSNDMSSNASAGTSGTGEGIGEKISNFFHGLSGGDEHAHSHYARGVNEGGALLTVKTDDEDAEEMVMLMKQHGAREIEGGYGQTTGTAGAAGTAAAGYAGTSKATGTDYSATRDAYAGNDVAGQTAIPIVEEEMVVGKREVDRGGVRVYSHVVETPVQAQVDLHEERVNVTRRAVDRPATAADFEAGNRSTFEMRAMGEEAVVGKTSRVVEEVLVGKQGSDRTETINDSVRRTEVDVDRISGETVETAGSSDKLNR